MKPALVLRIVLIALIALATGPRPASAAGDRVVICGIDGLKRTVVFNFETGEPETETGFETCAQCIGCAPVLAADNQVLSSTALPLFLHWHLDRAVHAPQRLLAAHPARGPPVRGSA
ncbi:MAG: hypothetical protein AAF367_07905 [Pseudomonadota bacterium]